MTHHLHIAFAGAGGQLSIVVRNGDGETLHTEQRPGEGTEWLGWQGLCWALQYAAEQKAGMVTLYSHENCLKSMIARGRIMDDSYIYSLTAWRIILANFAGSVDFRVISRERNVAAWA